MDHVIRSLQPEDEAVLWEMLYQAFQAAEGQPGLSRDVVKRPELSRYVEGWGRPGDSGFVAHHADQGTVLGAAWTRLPTDQESPPGGKNTPQLVFAVMPGQRGHGIGTALLTHLVKSQPDQQAIAIAARANNPVVRLYERFGFHVVHEADKFVVMRRDA